LRAEREGVVWAELNNRANAIERSERGGAGRLASDSAVAGRAEQPDM